MTDEGFFAAPLQHALPPAGPAAAAAPRLISTVRPGSVVAGISGALLALSPFLSWLRISVVGISGMSMGDRLLSGSGLTSGVWTLLAGLAVLAVAGAPLVGWRPPPTAAVTSYGVATVVAAYPLLKDGWHIWNAGRTVSGIVAGTPIAGLVTPHVGIGIWVGLLGVVGCLLAAAICAVDR